MAPEKVLFSGHKKYIKAIKGHGCDFSLLKSDVLLCPTMDGGGPFGDILTLKKGEYY